MPPQRLFEHSDPARRVSVSGARRSSVSPVPESEEGSPATPPAVDEAALPPACERHAGGDYTGVDSLVA
eukprot:3410822-Rhodomonas_salina.1